MRKTVLISLAVVAVAVLALGRMSSANGAPGLQEAPQTPDSVPIVLYASPGERTELVSPVGDKIVHEIEAQRVLVDTIEGAPRMLYAPEFTGRYAAEWDRWLPQLRDRAGLIVNGHFAGVAFRRSENSTLTRFEIYESPGKTLCIGYYSNMHQILPDETCIMCGRVEVCGSRPTCLAI